jgi:hypothetical protein
LSFLYWFDQNLIETLFGSTLTAIVTGTQLTAAPTGNVNFFDGTTMIGSVAVGTAASGTTVSATLSTALNGPGGHTLSAQYVGDSNYTASTSPTTAVTVTAIPTVTTLSLASASVAVGAGDILTATVTSGSGVPSGMVTFLSGTTSLGTGMLTNGTAMLTTTSSVVGSETITATYNATGNFGGSTSAALMLGFTNPITLTLSPNAVSIAPGGAGTVTVTAAPATGFSGAISFACTSPVAYITCSLTPSSQTISGTTAVQSTLTLNVAATVSSLEPTMNPGTVGAASYALLLPFGGFALLGFVRGRKRLHELLLLFVLCLSLGAIAGIAGGGSSTPTPAPNKPAAPSGTQVVTITAKSPTTTQTIPVTVNIGS